MDIKKILIQIAAIKKSNPTLTTWEQDFTKSIFERAEKYGETLHVSDKQAAVIQKIFDKLDNSPTASPTATPFPVSQFSDQLPV